MRAKGAALEEYLIRLHLSLMADRIAWIMQYNHGQPPERKIRYRVAP